MAEVTRRIGLSLGADICWPQCYEDLMRALDLELALDGDKVRFAVERVSIEPFSLRQPVGYDLVIDRLTHWYNTSREWIKKAVLMDGTYVFNNPWSVQSMEKQTSYCAMMHLGMPVPETLLLPPKSYEDSADLEPTLRQYAKMFDLETLGEQVGYPCFMKPYDGGGWRGVTKIDSKEELQKAYDESGTCVMHLQAGLFPMERFVRCIGLGPQVKIVDYDPDAPHHARYQPGRPDLAAWERSELERVTLTINAFFGWDFNSCELIRRKGVWHPFDFANPCPDSQVTSLHEHFPWLVKAKLKWSLFCAATRRPMRRNLDWGAFYAVREEGMPFADALEKYAALAAEHFETERFHDFCERHLSNMDAVVWEYFGTDRAKDAVRQKVEALFPDHEWDEFTDKFWSQIQTWRDRQEVDE